MVDAAAVETVGEVLDSVFLGLVALLGFSLFFVRPRTTALLALAGFLTCYGLFLNLFRLPVESSDLFLALSYVGDALLTVGTICLVVLARHFPRPLRTDERRAMVAPFAVGIGCGLALAAVAVWYDIRDGFTVRGWDPPWLNALAHANYHLGFSVYCAVTMGLAIRCRHMARAGDVRAAQAAARVALAFGPVAMLLATPGIQDAAEASELAGLTGSFAFAVLAAAMPIFWSWSVVGLRPPVSASARNVVLVLLLFGLLALSVETLYPPAFPPMFAAARLTALVVLAYAILRQQLFDVDIKLKWTLRRGTVAALFLAVFFIVSQLAQNLLSDQFGWAMGGAAAGLMLFAISPIQRAAERLADKAMPQVRPDDPRYVLARKRDVYREAYAAAWSDGRMTPKDLRMLHQVRDALGLPDKEYAALEREWAKSAPKA